MGDVMCIAEAPAEEFGLLIMRKDEPINGMPFEDGEVNSRVKFVKLKDLRGVSVHTYASFLRNRETLERSGENIRQVMVGRHVSTDTNVVAYLSYSIDTIAAAPSYVVVAPLALAGYIALWLNSSVGRFTLLNYDSSILGGTTKKGLIENALIPDLDDLYDMIFPLAILNSYFNMSRIIAKYPDDNHRSIGEAAMSFYGRVEDLVAMQLLLPDEFKKEGVDIISPWRDICRQNNGIEARYEDIVNQLQTVYSFDNDLMRNVNMMKFFNSSFYNKSLDLLRKANNHLTF